MTTCARTPEELDASFEDVFVLRDADLLAGMFDPGAVMVASPGLQARGPQQIAALVAALWEERRTYVAEPRLVVQARDTALLLGEASTAVMRRGSDGRWRYAITLVSFRPPDGEEPAR